MLALPFQREEKKVPVRSDGPSDASSELLPLELWRGGSRRLLGEVIVRVQRGLGVEVVASSVELIGARFGNHIDGRALAAAIGGRESLRGNVVFLHRGERKLHHGTPNGIVLVIYSVHRDVYVPSVGSIDGHHCHAVFRWVIRVH